MAAVGHINVTTVELTNRELFTLAMAHANLCRGTAYQSDYEFIAAQVALADALIAELAKEPTP